MHPDSETPEAAREMPRYQSHKKVWALQIKEVWGLDIAPVRARLVFMESGYAPLLVNASELFARYTPKVGDYYVVYDDGYKSISPQKAFEEGYTLVK